MNYPIWDIPAGGLLIAGIAILHVFISHFAVGGGLFLVLLETKARRANDLQLLDYVRRHSRFFLLLTLVLGALTGVGIWFTIGLVNPQGTASLIATFMWGWAIEWTFFVVEIAAAMVYYYGWDRLDAKQHLRVGWIYFGAAWLSLVAISGIIGYMLTPGDWVVTRDFWDGFLNPSFWPQVFARTFICIGLAGLYALFTVSFSKEPELRLKVTRYAGLYWIIPMAVALPLSVIWYLKSVAAAGIPVASILGAESSGIVDLLAAAFRGSASSGYPSAQSGSFSAVSAPILILALTVAFLWKSGLLTRWTSSILMLLGLVGFGGFEFVREDLRKPWVIGQFMFVNGVRLPAPPDAPAIPASYAQTHLDRFSVTALNENGLLQSSVWSNPLDQDLGTVDRRIAEGGQVFKMLCWSCHTIDGYQAVRPLVSGQSVSSLEGLLDRLAQPVDSKGSPTSWSNPALQLNSWMERRMPPFVGSAEEKKSLAAYLSFLGGAELREADFSEAETSSSEVSGETYFEEYCALCHSPDGEFPIVELVKDRKAEEFYEQLGNLEELNELMPPFEGNEAERQALAQYLEQLVSSHSAER